jgi:DNA helicase II / ATP-dependent DNA helicase PcrA
MNLMTPQSQEEVKEKIIEGLNPEQKAAVVQIGSPLLVLAGAGSGKTRVLTNRIAYFVACGVHPANILAVTFTNKAAKEMKERINKMVDDTAISKAWIGTFHSICARILRQDIESLAVISPEGKKRHWTRSFTIFDETDSVNVVKQAIKALDLDPKIYVPKSIKYKISEEKNQKKFARDFSTNALNYRDEKIGDIFAKYEEIMERNNALDFDDLLLFTVLLFEQSKQVREYYYSRFKHVLIDEYQDTNQTQYQLIRLIVEGPFKEARDKVIDSANDVSEFRKDFENGLRSLTVVGDVDQSIYSWRGADFKIIIGFQQDYPGADLIKLENNYRSSANILKVADSIIANNSERLDKNLLATKEDGEKITVFEAQDELEESQYIAAEIQKLVAKGHRLTEIAVLYRTNFQSRAIEEAFLRRNIPYVIVGGFRFYDRKEIKDMISYLKVLQNPADAESVKRTINEPRRGIGATTISKVEEYAAHHGFSLYRTLMEIDDVEGVGNAAKTKIKTYVDLIEDLRLAEKSLNLGDLVDDIVNKSGYVDMLRKASDAESESRIENIYELIGVATDFAINSEDPSLAAFLAEISLLSEGENTKKSNNNITMMTMHAAKGLEFPVVFIGGMEEGLFPHQRSLETQDKTQLEEERRLMYVGVTRAEDKLYLTHARRRKMFGQSEFALPSRFLEEAPKELLIGYYGQSNKNDRSSSFDRDEDSFGTDDTSHWSADFSGTQIKKQKEAKGGVRGSSSFYDDSSYNRERNFGSGVKKTPKRVENTERYVSKQVNSSFKIEFKEGDIVKHASFGEGTVLQVLGSGEKVLYNIDFGETKKLLDPKYAKLIKQN